jgi:hypothetical protein
MLALILAALSGSHQSLEDEERALREKLAKIERSRPDSGKALEEWERSHFETSWEYGVALYRLAEKKRDPVAYRAVIKHFTDFIWRYEDYLAALQARIYIARAHQALEEWGPCFSNLAKARRLDKPEERKNPELVEIATRSHTAELRARAAQKTSVETALQGAQDHLKKFPALAESEPFSAMRIEIGRAFHAVRKVAECEKTLSEVATRHLGSQIGDEALEALATLVPNPEHLLRFAERLFEKHHFTSAAGWFARAPKTPHVWSRRGTCYTYMKRFYEAVEALGEACKADHPERLEAAVRLEQVLRHLVTRLGDEKMRARLSAHREWMRKTLDLAEAGPKTIHLTAGDLMAEGKYREAADLFLKIQPGQEQYADAVHSLGYCHYQLKEYEKAAAALQAYLGLEKRTPRSSGAALDLACWSLLALGRPQEVLQLTERTVPADPDFREWRLAHRVDAFGRLGRFKEAHGTLASMKESEAARPTVRALARLAAAYEEAIRKTGEKKLWGPYARLVLAVSEKGDRLRGEKLLAAADALMLEETPDGYGLAYDLYAQYLLDSKLRADERDPIQYRQATAAGAAGRPERAYEIALDLVVRNPFNGNYRELRGDLAAALAAKLARGAERNRFLDDAIREYAELSTSRKDKQDEHYFRLTWKYATQLFARDPEQARDFFGKMEMRGYALWDEDKWGYRAKMESLKGKILEVLPRRR